MSWQPTDEQATRWSNNRYPTGAKDEYFAVGSGGWLYFHLEDPGLDLRLFVASEGGGEGHDRTVIAGIAVFALRADGNATAISASRLKEISLGRIETLLNMPTYAALLAASAVAVTGVDFSPAACPPGEAAKLADRFPMRDMPQPLLLIFPDARKKPDEFYVDVAQAYGWASQIYRNPAQALAEENGVNTTTVHRWLKEARRRRVLPPARRSNPLFVLDPYDDNHLSKWLDLVRRPDPALGRRSHWPRSTAATSPLGDQPHTDPAAQPSPGEGV